MRVDSKGCFVWETGRDGGRLAVRMPMCVFTILMHHCCLIVKLSARTPCLCSPAANLQNLFVSMGTVTRVLVGGALACFCCLHDIGGIYSTYHSNCFHSIELVIVYHLYPFG